MVIVYTTVIAALLLPALAIIIPPCIINTVYHTTSNADVTKSFGDHGWINYDSNLCTAGSSTCSDTEGKSISKTIDISFGGGISFELAKAIPLGLTFGVSVALTTTTSQSTTESCPSSGDDSKSCVCGLQYMVTQHNAKWTREIFGCEEPRSKMPFDVTAPELIDGKARTQWRTCRAAASVCSQLAHAPACADGL